MEKHRIPIRSQVYALTAFFHTLFTLISPFYTVPLVVWLSKRNLYGTSIACTAGIFFAFLFYFGIKRWHMIKADRRLSLIFILSLLSYFVVYETVSDRGEKLHVLNFSVLALLIYKACSPLVKLERALLLSWILPGLVAFIDEYLQKYIPGRVGTMHDVLIAVRSAVLGGVLAWIFDAYSRKGRQHPA